MYFIAFYIEKGKTGQSGKIEYMYIVQVCESLGEKPDKQHVYGITNKIIIMFLVSDVVDTMLGEQWPSGQTLNSEVFEFHWHCVVYYGKETITKTCPCNKRRFFEL